MTLFDHLLNRAFSLMAVTGLLLAGWGLIVTPDEIKNDARWGARETSWVSVDGSTPGTTSWQ